MPWWGWFLTGGAIGLIVGVLGTVFLGPLVFWLCGYGHDW
jgi:hypothetical protein